VKNTPADGLTTGIGSVNAALFGAEASRCVVMAYDATVLAGTQGQRNHAKTDRLLGVALQQKLPVVLFAEGGGGRPGDTDSTAISGLHVPSFASYARLSGQVPVVGIVAGRCFAGNAALLGCSDVIIATKGSNIGMGGPAMVEGGGLGVFKPEQIGPSEVQSRNGVIDVLVDDEAQAVAAAKHYLGFFQGRVAQWSAGDPAALRSVLPENRVRTYDMRAVMRLVADTGSLLELRVAFGTGIFTALARLEGRPVGLLASNPMHLGGAIDANAADKAARFMQLCNTHGLPLVSLVDTPGFMVGPEIEALGQVRHVSRMFVAAAHLRVPFFAVVLRKGYGLGAMAMAGGGFHEPVFTVAWPSGEFGAMGLEGAVRLGYRKELEAVPEGPARDALYAKFVDEHYARGKAINVAAGLEIDAVIDPAQTRAWLSAGEIADRRFGPVARLQGRVRGFVAHRSEVGRLGFGVRRGGLDASGGRACEAPTPHVFDPICIVCHDTTPIRSGALQHANSHEANGARLKSATPSPKRVKRCKTLPVRVVRHGFAACLHFGHDARFCRPRFDLGGRHGRDREAPAPGVAVATAADAHARPFRRQPPHALAGAA
jgi:acetyl-CoA carboxylase carboxyltransferase component